MEKTLINPFLILSRDSKNADVFIKGPVEDILIADFDFDKDHVRVFGKITSHMLYQLYSMFQEIHKDLNRQHKINKEASDESK